MRYHRGHSRYQQSFLSLEDLIAKNNIVRFIDEICEEFAQQNVGSDPEEKGNKETGRKAYHPADLMKILVYGYFYGVNSSRRLEREASRNLEVKWLTGDLVPDHKTIADFRRDNGKLVEGLFTYLIKRFKEEGLVKGKSVAVDGSKIKANAHRDINVKELTKQIEDIDNQAYKYIQYLEAMDTAEDDLEAMAEKKAELERQTAEIKRELAEMALKKRQCQEELDKLKNLNLKSFSEVDPDSKVMRGRGGKFLGYNVQTAVDTQHHFITKIEATTQQNDKGLLVQMVEASQAITGEKVEEVRADAGYYMIDQIEQLEQRGTHCYVNVNKTASQVRDEDREIEFTYDSNQDVYHCNENQKLTFRGVKRNEKKKLMRVYKGLQCSACPKKPLCTTASNRSVYRNENQEWIDHYHKRMESEEGKQQLAKRKSIVEHPFATMKYQMGQIPILLRGRDKVQTEMNLHGIGYNLKRYMSLRAKETANTVKKSYRPAA